MPDLSRDTRQEVYDLSIRLILLLGTASLLGSLVSNGARSVTGPYILLLGGSAAAVGLVAGFGEFIGYALRTATGTYVDRNRRYWKAAMAGYGLLAAIPLLAVVGRWETAAVLIVAERVGKAVRTPARDTILSHATTSVGRGWGFGVHKALDQVGAVIGPLVMVAALAITGGYAAGFLVLGIPLIGVTAVLLFARYAVPRPGRLETNGGIGEDGGELPGIMPYAAFIFLGMAGFVNFPLISFHLKAQSIIPDAAIPLFYASAMVASVIVALLVGRAFDRIGIHVLLAIPVLSIATILLAFSLDPGVALARGRGGGGPVRDVLEGLCEDPDAQVPFPRERHLHRGHRRHLPGIQRGGRLLHAFARGDLRPRDRRGSFGGSPGYRTGYLRIPGNLRGFGPLLL